MLQGNCIKVLWGNPAAIVLDLDRVQAIVLEADLNRRSSSIERVFD